MTLVTATCIWDSPWRARNAKTAKTILALASASSRPDSSTPWAFPSLQGRDFNDQDRNGSERVVIVSESLVKKLLPGKNPLDHQVRWTDPLLKFTGMSGEPRRIIGVVPDFDDSNLIPLPSMAVYQPSDQEGLTGRLFVRATNDPYELVPAITKQIHSMSADQPVERANTLDDIRAEIMTPDRLNAIVFGGFAGLALLISVVGVAGVLAFSVSGRTHEFGIRLALGAQPQHVLTDVLHEGMVIATIGVAGGLLAGFALARLIARYTTEVQIPGVLPLIASAGVILVAALIASAVPAARAASVDAVQALRCE